MVGAEDWSLRVQLPEHGVGYRRYLLYSMHSAAGVQTQSKHNHIAS